jgi:hypothetical protein
MRKADEDGVLAERLLRPSTDRLEREENNITSKFPRANDEIQPFSYEDEADQKNIRKLLYTSHFLSTWNSRLFEFGAFLFLANIFPQTLLPASLYALCRNASAAVAAPWIGSYIDRADRLVVVRISIGMMQRGLLSEECPADRLFDSGPKTCGGSIVLRAICIALFRTIADQCFVCLPRLPHHLGLRGENLQRAQHHLGRARLCSSSGCQR